MITQFLEIYPHLELAKTAAATIKGGNQPDHQNARATAEKKKRAELPPRNASASPVAMRQRRLIATRGKRSAAE